MEILGLNILILIQKNCLISRENDLKYIILKFNSIRLKYVFSSTCQTEHYRSLILFSKFVYSFVNA